MDGVPRRRKRIRRIRPLARAVTGKAPTRSIPGAYVAARGRHPLMTLINGRFGQ
jgi:hypothetical protein